MRTHTMTFEEWEKRLDAELLERTCCTWAELCGDAEPIRDAYEEETSVEDFATHIIRKHNLVEMRNLA